MPVLTEAARRTTTRGRGTSSEQQDQADFAEFLTPALAGTAANLGGIEPLLAGRSGSWEADYVATLLVATVGYDEQYLDEHRTEPLVIRVHVDDILNELGFWTLYDEAHDELTRRDATGTPATTRASASRPSGAQDLAEHDLICELHEALDRQREQDCAAYGAGVRRAARAAAAELFPGLRMPVEVIVELGWHNDIGLSDTECRRARRGGCGTPPGGTRRCPVPVSRCGTTR